MAWRKEEEGAVVAGRLGTPGFPDTGSNVSPSSSTYLFRTIKLSSYGLVPLCRLRCRIKVVSLKNQKILCWSNVSLSIIMVCCWCLHSNLALGVEIGKIARFGNLPISSRRADLTGGMWPVWPSESEADSVFVGCRDSLLRGLCFGFLWFLSQIDRGGGPVEGKTNPYLRDKASSIVKYQTIYTINRIVLLPFITFQPCFLLYPNFSPSLLICAVNRPPSLWEYDYPFVGSSRKPSVCPRDR